MYTRIQFFIFPLTTSIDRLIRSRLRILELCTPVARTTSPISGAKADRNWPEERFGRWHIIDKLIVPKNLSRNAEARNKAGCQEVAREFVEADCDPSEALKFAEEALDLIALA